MRKLIYHVASTLDGFIAHEDHSVDGFLNEGNHADDYLASLHTDYDAVIMGRKTYDFGVQFGVTHPYPWLTEKYVVSKTMKEKPDEHVEVISEKISERVQQLKNKAGKDIYLCGGAALATMLLNEKLVDDVMVKLNPVLFGSGIPLISKIPKWVRLELKSSKTYNNGVVLLHYSLNYE
jgi:dihydrofolate reductase